MSFAKIIFIGLPGSGKTSAAAHLAKEHHLQVCSVDARNKEILNEYMSDSAAPMFQQKLTELKAHFKKQGFPDEKVEQAFMRQGYDKHSTAFMKLLHEPCWREVEAALAVLLIQHCPEDTILDLGASQPLNPRVHEALQENNFCIVYLDANEAAIISHLSTRQADGTERWKSISNYNNAGENWRALAQTHRKERAAKYEGIAMITIDVDADMTVEEIVDATQYQATRNNLYRC